jgi:hypothetical protein
LKKSFGVLVEKFNTESAKYYLINDQYSGEACTFSAEIFMGISLKSSSKNMRKTQVAKLQLLGLYPRQTFS